MLKAYSFDIDYNLFCTDTTIYLDKLIAKGRRSKIEVSQKDYEILIKDKENYRHVEHDIEKSMKNFKTPGMLEKAVFDAISNDNLWPSYPKSIEAKTSASPTQRDTARGVSVYELKNTDRRIIYEVLTNSQREDLIYSMKERLWIYKKDDDFFIKTYLDNNMYSPCSNEEYLKSINKNLSYTMQARKNSSFEHFIPHIKWVFTWYYGKNFLEKRKIRMGFSDDNQKNIEWLRDFISKETNWLMWKYPDIIFNIYDSGEINAKPIKSSYENML